jgi:hypothetical protein
METVELIRAGVDHLLQRLPMILQFRRCQDPNGLTECGIEAMLGGAAIPRGENLLLPRRVRLNLQNSSDTIGMM